MVPLFAFFSGRLEKFLDCIGEDKGFFILKKKFNIDGFLAEIF